MQDTKLHFLETGLGVLMWTGLEQLLFLIPRCSRCSRPFWN